MFIVLYLLLHGNILQVSLLIDIIIYNKQIIQLDYSLFHPFLISAMYTAATTLHNQLLQGKFPKYRNYISNREWLSFYAKLPRQSLNIENNKAVTQTFHSYFSCFGEISQWWIEGSIQDMRWNKLTAYAKLAIGFALEHQGMLFLSPKTFKT